MSDGWERPAVDGVVDARAVVVDVPLTSDVDQQRSPDGLEPSAPNWRRLVGVALAVGVTLGVVVAVVRLVADDPADSEPSPVGDSAAGITTPPTLRALETLPAPGTGTTRPEAPETPTGSVVAPVTPTEPVAVPTYPPASGAVLSDVVEYDIAAAVARLGDDVSRRSDTRVELGYGGYVLDVSIERDPERDRYRLVFESSSYIEEVIVDVATGTTYIQPGTEREQRIRNEQILPPGVDGDIHDYLDRFLLGPLRPDTYDPMRTRGRQIVTIDDVGDAREFVTQIAGDVVPEWQIYAFGPVGEFVPSDRPTLLEYAVYVADSDEDRIVQVDGVALLGNVPQLIRHRLTQPDEPIVIALPDEPPLEPVATTLP
ncbi:MAG: hypothetical protein R8G01_17935 [Ilumatobacteraceae bacterium]|nr:hypothetical protein [Ilumatobacteraceae bacterium]